MIEQGDIQELPGLYHRACDRHVIRAGCAITGRVIVAANNGGGHTLDGGLEDLGDAYLGRVHAT